MTCKVLAILTMGVGLLMGLAAFGGGGNRGELAAFIGAVLFGSGLISLTILACTEPRWPPDDERRRRYSNPDDRFEEFS